LRSFKDENGQNKYINVIKEMAAHNRESIDVDFRDLADNAGEPNICYFLPEAPEQVLKRLDNATTEMVNVMFPWYSKVTSVISVRIRNLPMEEEIRALRQNHLNTLIKSTGVVTVTTGILPQLAMAKYNCEACSYVIGPFYQRQDEESKPTTCPSCQSRGPFKLNVEEVSLLYLAKSTRFLNHRFLDCLPQLPANHYSRESKFSRCRSFASFKGRDLDCRFV
jgi:DNA replication licensing factor MCM2